VLFPLATSQAATENANFLKGMEIREVHEECHNRHIPSLKIPIVTTVQATQGRALPVCFVDEFDGSRGLNLGFWP
jgi:hypothetical protein